MCYVGLLLCNNCGFAERSFWLNATWCHWVTCWACMSTFKLMKLLRLNSAVWWSAAKGVRRRGHARWQKNEGWKEVDEGGGEICSTVCSPSQAMCMQGKHHGVFQGPSFLSHTLWASTLRVLIFFNSSSLFLSYSVSPFSITQSLASWVLIVV